MFTRRIVATVGATAVAAAGLVGLAVPAAAVETITLSPGALDPSQEWTVRVDGFPAMAADNIYIYWLTFENLRGSRQNAQPSAYAGTTAGEQTGAQCTAQTGVELTVVSGPGDPAPNGGTPAATGVPLNGCNWVDSVTFQFVFTGATGLNNSSVVDVTFPAGAFALPGSGGYAVHFTAGLNQEYDLDRECVGSCPVPVSVAVNAQGGVCTGGPVEGFIGGRATAPPARNCSRQGFRLDGFTTGPAGTGTAVGAGSRFTLQAGLTLYAKWLALPSAPRRPDVTPGFDNVLIEFRPVTITDGTLRYYELRRMPGRYAAGFVSEWSGNTVKALYSWTGKPASFQVRTVTTVGTSAWSTVSRQVQPKKVEQPKVSRTRNKGGGTTVKVSGRVIGGGSGITITPWWCNPSQTWCRDSSAYTKGTGRVTLDSRGRYSFERRFGRDADLDLLLIRLDFTSRYQTASYFAYANSPYWF
jgi:hypothetical protein